MYLLLNSEGESMNIKTFINSLVCKVKQYFTEDYVRREELNTFEDFIMMLDELQNNRGVFLRNLAVKREVTYFNTDDKSGMEDSIEFFRNSIGVIRDRENVFNFGKNRSSVNDITKIRPYLITCSKVESNDCAAIIQEYITYGYILADFFVGFNPRLISDHSSVDQNNSDNKSFNSDWQYLSYVYSLLHHNIEIETKMLREMLK